MNEDMTLDIIREMVNIGVGDAAAALSDLVQSRVLIKTPEVLILDSKDLPNIMLKEVQTLGVYITQGFHGRIRGRALLFYTKNSCNSLIKTILGKDIVTSALTDNAIATLQEIGNILMVSCVSNISNMIEDSVSFEIPDVTIEMSEGYILNIVKDLGELDKTIFVRNQMVVKEKEIEGYIFLLLSFKDFLFVVREIENKIKAP